MFCCYFLCVSIDIVIKFLIQIFLSAPAPLHSGPSSLQVLLLSSWLLVGPRFPVCPPGLYLHLVLLLLDRSVLHPGTPELLAAASPRPPMLLLPSLQF